mgnify:CR=1 FL=1
MKKILLIATGGTIASKYTEQGLSPQISANELLEYVPAAREFCTIDTEAPFSLDSTNVCAKHWAALAELIEKKYDAEEIQQRVLNGDGGSWIKEAYDPEVIFQLDRFHIYQEIKRRLKEKEAQEAVTELFESQKIDEMLEYIQIYEDSVESDDETDKRSSNAKKLYEYLPNNKEGLLPYQERGIKIPEAKAGILYKNMGVQENQNCTVITLRMKYRRMRWSANGANNMAKTLYRKENLELVETIERYTDGLVLTMQMEEVIESLSAAKAPKKEGKGNAYADVITHHIPMLDGMRTASRKAFIKAFCS